MRFPWIFKCWSPMSSGCWRQGHNSNSRITRWLFRLLRVPPDVSIPIRELREVTIKYEEREGLMVGRIKEKCDEARRLALAARHASGVEKETLRRQAMMCLKSKAQLQEQLNRTVARHLAVEAQSMQLEDASLTSDALSALRTSSRTMEAHGRHVDLERVQRLLERLEGQMVDSAEMGEAFGDMQFAPGSGMDETTLEGELEALLEEDVVVELPSVPAPTVTNVMRTDGTQTMDMSAAAPPVASEKEPLLGDVDGDALTALRKVMAPSAT